MTVGIGQISWTITEFVRVFPEYDVYADGGSYDQPSAKYQKLYKMFHEVLTDQQLKWFRANWHVWRVEGDETAEKNIKAFIKQYLED